MTLAPGSGLWMVRHEMRLYWRSGVQMPSVVFIVITQVLLHLIALGIALAGRSAGAPALPHGLVVLGVTMGMGFALLIMISRGLSGAIQALYTRGDFDLLLSSPIAPGSIVAVRAAAIALSVTIEFAVLLWPFANVFVVFGRFDWLKAYLLLPALGMLATSLSLLLMLALFRLLGPRRTRVAVQVAAAVIGMSFVLLGAVPNALRGNSGYGPGAGFGAKAPPALTGPLAIPAEQVLNGFWPTLLFAAVCAAALMLTVRAVSGRFIEASSRVAGLASGGRHRTSSNGLKFRAGLRRILIAKELRLIARDPWVLTQLLGQMVFLVPLGLMLWRRGASAGIPWAWLMIIFVCGSFASALAWLTVSAEDAPELLAASPVSAATLIRAKVEAALLPLVPFIVAPTAALWRSHLGFGVLLSLCAAACGVSCALLQIRNPVKRKRADFKTRHKGTGISGIIELTVIAAWVGLCAALTWIGSRYN